ncbi:MAG: formate dehydrogenase accessory sulfurtransferase FdhD [Anaerolineaceae bacterium]
MDNPQEVHLIRYADGAFTSTSAVLPYEYSVTLIVNGKAWMEMICTPSNLQELAVGFLYNEDLINSREEIKHVFACDSSDAIEVETVHPIQKPSSWVRTTGCSGGQTSRRLEFSQPLALKELTLSAEALGEVIRGFAVEQSRVSSSRGTHCSGLYDGKAWLAIAEDIGRHNTLDKLMGHILLHKPSASPALLITTGRISSEMLQKAARIGTSILVSFTSPNLFTVSLAKAWGMTLVGYARPAGFNIYCGAERITR